MHTQDQTHTTDLTQALTHIISEDPSIVNTKEHEKSNFKYLFRKRKLKLPIAVSQKRSKVDTRVSQNTLVVIRFNIEPPEKIHPLWYKDCNGFKSGTWRQSPIGIPSQFLS